VQYASIIFLQNEDDFADFSGKDGTGYNGFFNASTQEQIAYLAQWDNADSPFSDIAPYGSADHVIRHVIRHAIDSQYVYALVVNRAIGYAGLTLEDHKVY